MKPRIGEYLPKWVRKMVRRQRALRFERDCQARFAHQRPGKPHALGAALVVSLTSYPARFEFLDLTVRSLLQQSLRPDRIVLWIADTDAAKLPTSVRKLARQGLELRLVPDLRSYKKLVFAVEQFPAAYLVTADDDVYYPPQWLAELVDGIDQQAPVITCHRAHRWPPVVIDNNVPPYVTWEWDVQDEAARRPSTDLLPTGLGGICYPPGSLHHDVVDANTFMSLCPQADDLWFYWMARRAGSKYRKVGGVFEQLYWPGSQEQSLWSENATANDRQIRDLVARYGVPTA